MSKPSERRTTNKGERSRNLILERTKTLIAEKGFLAVSLQDILEAAEVSKGRFFHHFKSKEDLFECLLRETLASRGSLQLSETAKQSGSRNPFSQLMFLLDRLIERHRSGLPEDVRLCVFATFFFAPDSPEMQRLSKLLRRNTKYMANLILACQKGGQLPRSLDAQALALLLPSAAVGGNIVGFLHKRKHLPVANLIQLKNMLLNLNKVSKKDV